jgi:hypothetical protein
MKTAGLLKSKSYGLGKELLWFHAKHKVITDLGYTPPKSEIHAFKYEHEKACADIFVSLALTNSLLKWEGEGNQKIGLRYDRMFRVDSEVRYLEVERGTQGPEKLREKLNRYVLHYRKTREPFSVLFTVPDEDAVEQLVYLFEELGLGNSYAVTVHSEFVNNPLEAQITSRFATFSLKI